MTVRPPIFDHSSLYPLNDAFEQSSPKRSKLAQSILQSGSQSGSQSSLCGIPTTPIASPLRRLALRSWKKRGSRHSSFTGSPPSSPSWKAPHLELPLRKTSCVRPALDLPQQSFSCLSSASFSLPLQKPCSVLSDSNSDDNDSDSTLASPSSYSCLNTNSYFDEYTCITDSQSSYLSHSPVDIFEVPEIVHYILSIVDAQYTHIPHEITPTKRTLDDEKPVLTVSTQSSQGLLYSCLLVNKLFCSISREIIHSKVLFSNESRFHAASAAFGAASVPSLFNKTSMVVLHKLFRSKQDHFIPIASRLDCTNLKRLELYMCPKLAPTPRMFEHGQLEKLVITGSRVVDDCTLAAIAKSSPKLKVLDLRACELVSDAGIYQISKHCRNLESINFGRKSRGHLVTDASIVPLVTSNHNLQTVGLAGCHISDHAIWAIAASCGEILERLSLNNCPRLSNRLIPHLLHSSRYPLPRLCVLELRFNLRITQWQPIIAFKRRQHLRGVQVLVEVCPTLAERMAQEQRKVDAHISRQIFRDILEWVNDPALDTDKPFAPLLAARGTIAYN